MAGRPRTFLAKLTQEERERLQAIVAARSSELRHHQRAQMILLSDEGKSNTDIAKKLAVSRPVVNKILKRYASAGVDAALEDVARPGRPQEIDTDERAWIKSLACTLPQNLPDGPALELWSISALTKYIQSHCKAKGFEKLENVGATSIWRILNEGEIKPHKVRYYLEKKDPEFEAKATEVLLLYKRVEWIMQFAKKYGAKFEEVFISYDEKPGIQAVRNKHPDRAPKDGQGFVRRDYEYVRDGTVSLLAGIDLMNGHVYGLVREKHTAVEFIEFLNTIDKAYPATAHINLILDNHTVHRSKATMDYLAQHPGRFKFTFTPKHASWLNLIEAFFGKMARTCLRGLRAKSKEELTKRITKWIEEVNATPVLYRWKWKLEDIQGAFTN